MKQTKALHKEPAIEPDESFASPVLTDQERKNVLDSVGSYRQKVSEEITVHERQIIQLSQLKYIMEDYVNSSGFNKNYSFGYFLKEYISSLKKKSKEFAEEIDLDPTELSQIINSHRYPGDKLLIRLELHSNRNFPAILWFRLLEKEKGYELLNNSGLRKKEQKHVKHMLTYYL